MDDTRVILKVIDEYVKSREEGLSSSFCSDRDTYSRKFGMLEAARQIRSDVKDKIRDLAREHNEVNEDEEDEDQK